MTGGIPISGTPHAEVEPSRAGNQPSLEVQVCAFEVCRKRTWAPHRNQAASRKTHWLEPQWIKLVKDPGEDIQKLKDIQDVKSPRFPVRKVIYKWWVVHIYVSLQELQSNEEESAFLWHCRFQRGLNGQLGYMDIGCIWLLSGLSNRTKTPQDLCRLGKANGNAFGSIIWRLWQRHNGSQKVVHHNSNLESKFRSSN